MKDRKPGEPRVIESNNLNEVHFDFLISCKGQEHRFYAHIKTDAILIWNSIHETVSIKPIRAITSKYWQPLEIAMTIIVEKFYE